MKKKYRTKKFTDSELYILAKQYSTIKDFKNADPSAYQICHKRGIISDLKAQSFFKILGNMHNKCVYVYFLKHNKCYVGQTNDFTRRHKEHLSKWLIESDIEKISISRFLEVKRATILEETLRQRYIKFNYNLINKNSCSSTGGAFIKWTKESCIQDASKYSYKKQWQNNSPSSYRAAWKRGWLLDCSKHFIPTSTLRLNIGGKEVLNINTGEIFPSATAASISLGLNKKSVSYSIKNSQKSRGQIFIYLNYNLEDKNV